MSSTPTGFDEDGVDLASRHRTMLDTTRHNEQLALAQRDMAVAQLDGQLSDEDEEQNVYEAARAEAVATSDLF